MRELGINVVRIYHRAAALVSRLLRDCRDARPDHAAVGQARRVPRPGKRSGARSCERCASLWRSMRGHPAIFGYLVGNEIPTTMVRWLGVRRVTEFLETLIRVGREADPNVLFSYASYPPTEYLLPQNVDFYCFNVYLHDQRDFERYLLRLQNLAEEKPLMLGEFGMDTIRHSEEEQAEMLGWHVDSVVRCGLAGTIFFTWTDEWFTGEQEITDWAFGLVKRDRSRKNPFSRCKKNSDRTMPRCRIAISPQTPFVSVIVCSYNGGKTLAECLESLGKIDYPAYEVDPGRRRLDR